MVCAYIFICFRVELHPAALDARRPRGGYRGKVGAGHEQFHRVFAIYEQYVELFGTNKPILEQFFIYIKNVVRGDFVFPSANIPER